MQMRVSFSFWEGSKHVPFTYHQLDTPAMIGTLCAGPASWQRLWPTGSYHKCHTGHFFRKESDVI